MITALVKASRQIMVLSFSTVYPLRCFCARVKNCIAIITRQITAAIITDQFELYHF